MKNREFLANNPMLVNSGHKNGIEMGCELFAFIYFFTVNSLPLNDGNIAGFTMSLNISALLCFVYTHVVFTFSLSCPQLVTKTTANKPKALRFS